MNEDKEFLGKEPIGKLLLRLALPTVAAQLINMLYNIVDRIYIGHIPEIGAKALTGVGVCMPLILIVSAFAALVGYGGAPRASIAMGRKDNEAAEKILGNCFTVQILISVILTVIWNRDFLMAFGASENTIEYGVRYMSIYALGTLFVEVTLGMNSFITAQGFAKTGMLSVLIGAVANIILDPIFIFGFDMDVQGAALATILSQAMSCIWVVWFLCGKKTTLKIRRKNIGITPKVVLPCLALGVSVFVMQASESVISVCFNSSLQKYGGDIAVGAMTILTSVMQFAMLPLQGLGQGAQPIISYNYGAGNMKRVRRTFRLLLQSSLAYSTVLWLLILLFPQGFAAMFTSDPELMIFTRTALRIYMAACVIFGIQIACQMTFNALGNAVESITVAVVRKFVLLIPLIYLMPMLLKGDQAKAVYMAEPIADVIAVMFTACLFFLKKFSGRADDYVAGRPAYAEEFVRWLALEQGFSEETIVADIGSGTGKFAKQLLKMGCFVYGIEPNDDMRKKAEENFLKGENFCSVKGTANKTTLKEHAVDVVTSAQAFHWFDVTAFQKECRRILKPDGRVYLIWNVRDMGEKLNQETFAIYRTFCPRFQGFSGGMKKDDERIQTFFEGHYQYRSFDHPLSYTEETFIRRSLSGSYSLKEGDVGFEEYLEALKNLYRKYNRDGILTMGNHTAVYYGRLQSY